MEASNIRIDASLVQANTKKIVRVMGKCESFDQGSGQAIISCNGTINLDLSQVSDTILEIHKNYEFIGKVGNDLKITVYSIIELSDNLDLNIASKLAHYAQKVPELYIE
ncbi:hypothetical protein SBY92_004507 [Candida maltosa Xu316]